MGSFNFIGELLTDLPLDADEPYVGTCGKCFRCGVQCPTDAILPEGQLNANLCISYLTIENKGAIPVELRPKLGQWVFGCDVCQVVCPYNQRPPETPWAEFQPASGVGHYMDLLSLLEIKDEEEFFQRFQHTPLRRPKRRGILRNALVVLGNQLRERGSGETKRRDAIDGIEQFRSREDDPMLQEHADWALEQSL
jgi:epoxyqueuosine reductase